MGLLVLLAFSFLAAVAPPAQAVDPEFVTTWQTENLSSGSSASSQIRLPLTSNGVYNFTVDWGDGQVSTITNANLADATHTYVAAGTKTVTIAGQIEGWRFANDGDRLKLTDISSWGPLKLGNDGGYFWGASNLQISATDEPDLSGTTNLSSMFFGASALTGGTLSDWDVATVTDMSRMFYGATAFNGDISGWNVGAVTTMGSMFRGATAFNQDIGNWSVGAVTTMTSMFRGATAFKQDLGGWTVTSLTDASNMFLSADVGRTNYDALLVGWAAQMLQPKVTFDGGNSKYTQGAASAARASLEADDQWEITDAGLTTVPDAPPNVVGTKAPEKATITWGVATDNNSPILDYTVHVTAPDGIEPPLPCVTTPTNRTCVFEGLQNGVAYSFSVTARNEVGASQASQTTVTPQIDPPGIPSAPKQAVALDGKAYVTFEAPTTGGVPSGYTVTSYPDSKTCTTTVSDPDPYTCTVEGLTNGTTYTFKVAASNVGGTSAESGPSNSVVPGPVFATTWDTTKTRDLSEGGTGENRIRLPLTLAGDYDFVVAWGDGQVSRIIKSDVTAEGIGITHTYDTPGVKNVTITGTIKGWNLNHGVPRTGERDKLIGISSWGPLRLQSSPGETEYFADAVNLEVTATDALNMIGTTSLKRAFAAAPKFNGPIGNWDVSAVTDMSGMFAGATSFDQPLPWSTGAVTDMSGMFRGATAFNQDVSEWSVGNVTDMSEMFAGATSFNSDVSWTSMPKVATAAGMFDGARAFNQALGWPASLPALADTSAMFRGATSFNGDISGLDMSDVTDASSMFEAATSFNGAIGSWNTSKLTEATDMFSGASAFNQDLSAWNFEPIESFGKFLYGTATGIHNYNLFLQRLAAQNVQPVGLAADRTIDSRAVSPVALRQYSVGQATAAREEVAGRGFTVLDDGQTNQNIPNAPSGINRVGSGTSATISWVAPADNNSPITAYTVVAVLVSDPSVTVTCQTTTTSCTFSETLAPSFESYLIQVTATNGIGTSVPSDSTAPLTPDAPAVVAGNGKVTVSVTPPTAGARPSTYTIVEATDPTKTCTITAPDTSCDVTGLTNKERYRFTAQARNWVGDSEPSAPSAFTSPGVVFASAWRTGNTSAGSSNGDQVALPLVISGTYDFYVSWGDGQTDHITSATDPKVTHTYARAGLKDITITGTIRGWRFDNKGDRLKLVDISAWGSLALGNEGSYFYGASNLVGTATDAPNLTNTSDLSNAFLGASALTMDVSAWQTGAVTDLTNAFKGTTSFVGTGLGTWDVGNVIDMYGTFQDSAVNTDISGWDVAEVTDMFQTFSGATAFNQPLGNWDVSKVEDMRNIFAGATAFNQEISGWQTTSLVQLSGAFQNSGFNGDISTWNITKVSDFSNLFRKTGNLTGAEAVAWYNKLLVGWAAQDVQDESAGNLIQFTVCGSADITSGACGEDAPQYSPGAPALARSSLVDRGWRITDGGESLLRTPSRVTDVVVTDGPTVTWSPAQDNGSPLLSYTVTARPKAGGAEQQCQIDPEVTQAACPVVGEPSAYYWIVTATNAIGTSEESFYAAPDQPAAPVVVPGNGSARVIVTTSSQAEAYRVEVVGDSTTTCTITAPDTTCLIDGLTNGTEYQFRVQASNSQGDSAWSTASRPVTPKSSVFTTTWQTDRTSAGSTTARKVGLPLSPTGTYDFEVHWGDGPPSRVTSWDDADATHLYVEAGTKYIAIDGQLEGWRFNGGGDRLKLGEVSNWGALKLGNDGGYFAGAANMTVSARDTLNLNGTTDLSDAFKGAAKFNGPVDWNVSAVTDMSGLFEGASSFNQDLSLWDTRAVTDMSRLFHHAGASGFVPAVTGWDVSNVTTFEEMFVGVPGLTGIPATHWYNELLTLWASQTVQQGTAEAPIKLAVCVSVDGIDCTGGVQYYGGEATVARDALVAKNWEILDGGATPTFVPDTPAGIQLSRDGSDLTVTWTAPSDNGSPITGYKVVADPGGAFCQTAATSCTLSGLSADPLYKYSVVITATNGIGDSIPSDPYPELRPGKPGTPTATRGNGQAVVTVAPSTGGGEPNRYTVTSNPDARTCEITELSQPLRCTVTGLTNGQPYTFTVVADNDGGSSDVSNASVAVTPLAPGLKPDMGEPTPTADGFTVLIENFSKDDSYEWSVDSFTPEGARVTVDQQTGLVTVDRVAPDTPATIAVRATQFGYEEGISDEVTATSLKAAFVPVLGTPTPIANGFTIQITNFATADPAVTFGWTVTPDGGKATIDSQGLVTVHDVSGGVQAELTVTATWAGHATGQAKVKETALFPAVVPVFGQVTREADGFSVPLTNWETNKSLTWSVDALTPPAVAAFSEGVVTVTGLTLGQEVTITVRAEKAGWAPGRGTLTSAALKTAHIFGFGTASVSTTGFTVPITSFNKDDEFTWSVKSIDPATGKASIDAETGMLTVSDIAPGVKATVVVTATSENHLPGENSIEATTAIAPALAPDFDAPVRTPDGFTVLLKNYLANPDFTWKLESSTAGTAVLDKDTGVITVTGLTAGAKATIAVSTKRFGYVDGGGQIEGTALEAALTPTFGTKTPTVDGFTVEIDNYLENKDAFDWEAEDPAGTPEAKLDLATGLVTVSKVTPGTESSVTVTTTREGYVTGRATATETSLTGPGLVPTFGTLTRTADGFTVQISNYAENKDTYTWVVEDPTGTPEAALDLATGLVTVTKVAADTEETVTVKTSRTGYADASAPQTGRSLKAALVPTFGTLTRTAVGFTVQIKDFDKDDAFTWTVDSVSTGQAELNQDTGLVTVTGVAPGATATVVVATTRADHAKGTASQEGQALQAALVPTFGTLTRTAVGFTVQIKDFDKGDAFTWTVDSVSTGQAELNQDTGLVTVTGVAPGATATVVVATTRIDHAKGTASQEGQALQAALVPTFGTLTRTADGFTVQIADYAVNKDAYVWAVVDPVGTPEAAIDLASGLVTVTKVAPGAKATVVVTTSRSDHTPGSASQEGQALQAALDPEFDPASPTADGFTVRIKNKDDAYSWTVDSVTAGEANLDQATGVVTVTEVDPGTLATVRIRTTRVGYVDGVASVTEKSINGAAVTPTFGQITRTADGFTVPLTNFASDDPLTWALDSVSPDSTQATLNQTTGEVTVTGALPGTETTVTVTTTRTGYDMGSAQKSGRALYAGQAVVFGEVTRTADGFTVPVVSFDKDDAFTWSAVSAARVIFDQGSGVVTVTGLAPGAEATVFVKAAQDGYVDGTQSIKGSALNGALTPTFGAVAREAGGFTVPITNFGKDDPYTWDVTVDPNTATANVNQQTGEVSVAGLADGAQAEVTVMTSRSGHVGGIGRRSGAALNAPRLPSFGSPVRTADGFQVQLTNFDAAWGWQATASSGVRTTVNATGLVSVTGLAPDTAAVITVTATRDGYRNGSQGLEARSLKAALVPSLGTAQRKSDGFVVPVGNYDEQYDWTVTATNTEDEVTISDAGVIEVTGLAPGEAATVRVVSKRTEHADGETQTVLAALEGEALTPAISAATATVDGFTAQITNYKSTFTWQATATSGSAVTITPSGLLTVTGLPPSSTATATVSAARAGFTTGSASVSGSSLAGVRDIADPPEAPTQPTIEKVGHPSATSLKFTWATRSDGGSPIRRATVTCQSTQNDSLRIGRASSEEDLVVKRLAKKTKYRCSVAITNAVATSVDSETVVVKTKAPPKKEKPKKKPKAPSKSGRNS